jgi:DnaK suppressor protein
MTKAPHSHALPVTARPNRPAYWTDARLTRAANALWGRVAALRADIARELRKHDDERLGLIAAHVADSAELSIADVIGDVYLAEIERDVSELRGVESALERINAGTYGICIDCSEAVDPMRLEFNPHAAKCLRCQENAESSHRRTTRSAAAPYR